MKLPIYMDNNATTPVDPRALEAMLPCLTQDYGNAASSHSFGRRAAELVDAARAQVAALVRAESEEIVFTSGATESDNLAIKGVCEIYHEKGDHVISCVTEHKAVLDSLARMEKQGFKVTYLPVDRDGLVHPADVAKAVGARTILISIMAANNEIGVIAPVAEIGRITREKGVLFHCDAAQAAGKIPLDVQAMNIDLLSLSAHKMYGPKGVGALYVRKKNPRVRLSPMIDGGGQENGLRPGTLNVPGIVGFGKACDIAREELPQEMQRLTDLRERLRKRIFEGLDSVTLNGHPTQRLPGSLNIGFEYVEADALLTTLGDEMALSTGSACSSIHEPSYVIKALGGEKDLSYCSIRIGLGRFNTQEEVDFAADKIVQTVRKLRELSPLYEMAKKGRGA